MCSTKFLATVDSLYQILCSTLSFVWSRGCLLNVSFGSFVYFRCQVIRCTLTDCSFLMVSAGLWHAKDPGLCHVLKCKRVMTTDYQQPRVESNIYVPCVESIPYTVSSMILV